MARQLDRALAEWRLPAAAFGRHPGHRFDAMGVRAVSKVVSRSEAGRLGKRGSYRLGALGPAPPERPRPPRRFRMTFLGPQHRGSVTGWGLAAPVCVLC